MGAPIKAEVDRITATIMKELGDCDLESALTVLCGILGQVVGELSEQRPSAIQKQTNIIAENIKTAAIARVMEKDDKRRADAAAADS